MTRVFPLVKSHQVNWEQLPPFIALLALTNSEESSPCYNSSAPRLINPLWNQSVGTSPDFSPEVENKAVFRGIIGLL